MYSNIGHLVGNEFWEVLGRSPSGALLGQHDDLSARLVLLHAAMGLSDLVEVEGFADLDAQCARSDLLDQILERRAHEIFRFASIGGQADRSRDSLHWGDIVEGPFVADNAGHATDAAPLGATRPTIGAAPRSGAIGFVIVILRLSLTTRLQTPKGRLVMIQRLVQP